MPSATPVPEPGLKPDGCDGTELHALHLAFLGVISRWTLSGTEALMLLEEPRAEEQERRQRLNELVGLTRSLLLVLPEPGHTLCYLRRPSMPVTVPPFSSC